MLLIDKNCELVYLPVLISFQISLFYDLNLSILLNQDHRTHKMNGIFHKFHKFPLPNDMPDHPRKFGSALFEEPL